MNNNLRRNEKYFIAIIAKINIKVNLFKWYTLALGGDATLAHDLHSNTRLD